MATNNLSFQAKDYNVLLYGNATINSGTTYTDVSISGLPSIYRVICTPAANFNIFITNKTTSGFRINSSSAPGSNLSVDYIVIG